MTLNGNVTMEGFDMADAAAGEVVRRLNERSASFGRRLAAQVVDAVLVSAIAVLVGVIERAVGEDPTALTVVGWVITAAYYAGFEGWLGQTPGKRILRIRVVDDTTGAPIGYPRALLRFLVSWISFFACLIGYLAMLADPAGQTWHDRASHALVIDT